MNTSTSHEIDSVIARISEEKMELQEKLSRLMNFMGTEKYLKLRPAHRIMLTKQADVMRQYRDILDVRYDLLMGDLLQAQINEESGND